MSTEHGTDEHRSARVLAAPVNANRSPRRERAASVRREALIRAACTKTPAARCRAIPSPTHNAGRAPRPARRTQRRTSTSSSEGEPHPGGDR